MSPEQKLDTYLIEKAIDSGFIIQSLDNFDENSTTVIVKILHDATYNTSECVQTIIEGCVQKEIFVLYIPTYCPHLSKIRTLYRFINGATTHCQ